MTENYPPPSPQWSVPLPPASEAQGTTDVIKDQAADLGSNTVDAGKRTAAVAREQASEVAAEASQQGRDLLGQAQGQLAEQVAQGQQRLASELRSVGDELRSMAESSRQGGTASELARQIASRAQNAGQWLERSRPAEVVSEVQAFARRRPGMFLAVAAGVGLVAGRLLAGSRTRATTARRPAPPGRPPPGQQRRPTYLVPRAGGLRNRGCREGCAGGLPLLPPGSRPPGCLLVAKARRGPLRRHPSRRRTSRSEPAGSGRSARAGRHAMNTPLNPAVPPGRRAPADGPPAVGW